MKFVCNLLRAFAVALLICVAYVSLQVDDQVCTIAFKEFWRVFSNSQFHF